MAAFDAALTEVARRTEAALNDLLPPSSSGRVAEAMRYAVLSGGKRLRAFLVIEGARLFNVPQLQADRAAAAIECIHAYSLVHDDLPAMDDDDLRRGVPTVHRVWDDATAILAGDALQAEAFAILASTRTTPDASVRLKLIGNLAHASGVHGMVGGQDLDLQAGLYDGDLSLDAITELQEKKTGALIKWAAEAGPILGKSDIAPMTAYAQAVGLAFQIQDDVLDVIGDAHAAGKALRKDGDAGKATFVSHLGLDAARNAARALVDDACDALAPYHSAADRLRECAKFIVERDR